MSRHVGECNEDGCEITTRGEKCRKHEERDGPTFEEALSEAIKTKRRED